MIGRGNRSTRRKPSPVPLCPPQTPHAARTRTRAAAVGSQCLTAELRHGLSVIDSPYSTVDTDWMEIWTCYWSSDFDVGGSSNLHVFIRRNKWFGIVIDRMWWYNVKGVFLMNVNDLLCRMSVRKQRYKNVFNECRVFNTWVGRTIFAHRCRICRCVPNLRHRRLHNWGFLIFNTTRSNHEGCCDEVIFGCKTKG
jgi:hypothetical protein